MAAGPDDTKLSQVQVPPKDARTEGSVTTKCKGKCATPLIRYLWKYMPLATQHLCQSKTHGEKSLNKEGYIGVGEASYEELIELLSAI